MFLVILESRNILLLNACKHLRYHLLRSDELKLCTDILGEILRLLFKQKKQYEEQGKINNLIHHDVDILCINVLDVLVQTVLKVLGSDTKVIVSIKFEFVSLNILRDASSIVPISYIPLLGLSSCMSYRFITIIGRISL